MLDQLAVDPATLTRPVVWVAGFSLALATGLGVKAFRYGHDVLGPAVESVVLGE